MGSSARFIVCCEYILSDLPDDINYIVDHISHDFAPLPMLVFTQFTMLQPPQKFCLSETPLTWAISLFYRHLPFWNQDDPGVGNLVFSFGAIILQVVIMK